MSQIAAWKQRPFFRSYEMLFIASLLLVGLYYEPASALISVLFVVVIARHSSWSFCWSWALGFSAVLSCSYFLSCFWAIDRGLALWGGVKYLPVLLSALCLSQLNEKERSALFGPIPYLGAAVTVCSLMLGMIPFMRGLVWVNGRMAGVFQYPNTYAVFLLVGLIILTLYEEPGQKWQVRSVCGIILVYGILATASRAVAVLALPAMLAAVLCSNRKRALPLLLASAMGGGALAFLSAFVFHMGRAERLATTSLRTSTWLGRVLYWKDAIPAVLHNPLGLGHLGYYFTQGSFQTGVYVVRWVHNSFLQILLDVGWIPCLLLLVALVHSLFSRRVSAMQRIVLGVLSAHAFVDFDYEFVGMMLLMQLCMDWAIAGEEKERKGRWVPIAGAVISALCLYIGSTSLLSYAGAHRLSSQLCPWNTLSNLELLGQEEVPERQEELAEEILKQNPYVALAWNVQGQEAYSKGDFGNYILCKKTVLSLTRYDLEEYVDYYRHLRTGAKLYHRKGDRKSEEMIDDVLSHTDRLSYEIVDQPRLEMPEEYKHFCEKWKQQKK